MTTVLADRNFGLDKRRIMEGLEEQCIDSRPFFEPLSSLKAYEGSRQAKEAARRNVVSYDLSARGVNLPSGLEISRDDVEHVCIALRNVLGIRFAQVGGR